MKLPWQKKYVSPEKPDLEKACEDLQRVVAQRDEVERVAGSLGRHRKMNGFADLVFRPSRRTNP